MLSYLVVLFMPHNQLWPRVFFNSLRVHLSCSLFGGEQTSQNFLAYIFSCSKNLLRSSFKMFLAVLQFESSSDYRSGFSNLAGSIILMGFLNYFQKSLLITYSFKTYISFLHFLSLLVLLAIRELSSPTHRQEKQDLLLD